MLSPKIPLSPKFPASPLFFSPSSFETTPSRSRIRNGVRKSMLIDYDTKLDDENIPCLKLLLLGLAGVGKSALLIRYADDIFDELNLTITVGIDIKMKLVDVDGQLFKLVMWDTAGQERYRTITPLLYKDTHGILLVYDINNRLTFEDLEHWIDECIDNSRGSLKNVAFFVVGNKRDKNIHERQVFFKDLQKFSTRVKEKYSNRGVHIAGYYEVTAKLREDVKFLFRTFISECVRKLNETLIDSIDETLEEEESTVDLGRAVVKTYSCC